MGDKDAGESQGKRQVEFNPDGNSREAEAEASVVTSDSAMGDKEMKSAKRARIVWTADLHEKFVDAVNQLGVADASPSSIMTLIDMDRLTQPIVKSLLQEYRRSLREQQRWEGGAVGAQQVASEGGNSGVDQAFDTDNVQMRMKGVNVSDAHKVFDKMSQRTTWESESCATQIFSSSASQHEVSSVSASASIFRRLDESSASASAFPTASESTFRRLVESSASANQFDTMFSWLREEEDAAPAFTSPFLSFDWDFSPLFLSHPYALHYCALFPPDHEFEKDTLVQVWMALGIFVDEPMERFASQLFEDCLTKGYFLFTRANLVTGKAMYKFIKKTKSLPLSFGSHINLSMVSPEVTHASIRCCDLKDSTALLGIQRFKQLRALIFLHGHELSFKQVPRNFFLSLSDLQVLTLSKTRLLELPSSIGNMKCLCLLDLSDTPIKRLPEAIGCLEKLQTLKLKGCLNICTLPKGIRKLVNLRHLDFDVFRQLRSMPEGMGDLAKIQTLSAFLVGVEDGCSIRQIKNMNNLSGCFCISRLENVLTKDEAEEACLSNKTQLKKIELHWSDSQDEDVVGYEKVLSSLQPNASLEELNISCYGGLELPSWICDPKFSQLVCLTLFECENCLVLPSLGQLPSLKYLNIVNFHKLKVIDHKFYGNLGIQGHVAFPKLQNLTVENMLSLEEWSGIRSFEFPCLLNLTIKHCPKLHSLCTLSSLSSLEKLEISHCAVLTSCPDGKLPARVETFIIEGCPLISAKFLNGGEDWQKLANIPHIWIDHKEFSLG